MKYTPLLFLLLILSCQTTSPPEWMNYPTTAHFQELSKLPKAIKESSGLVYWQQSLWTLNDSGNPPVLYQIDLHKKKSTKEIPEGRVKKKKSIKVKGAKNIDWESLAQDSTYFYIGDFGNNKGTRNNLAIHLVAKDSLKKSPKEVAIAGSIQFTYQDQVIPIFPQRSHNFNCEAMIVGTDSIYLFSKNHLDKQTSIYRLPKTPGTAVALPGKKFQSDGLITGAAWKPAQKKLVLVGYNNYQGAHHPFVWAFSNYPGNDFFAGEAKRFNLPERLQIEGIAPIKGTQFLLTNEVENGKKGKVFLLDLK